MTTRNTSMKNPPTSYSGVNEFNLPIRNESSNYYKPHSLSYYPVNRSHMLPDSSHIPQDYEGTTFNKNNITPGPHSTEMNTNETIGYNQFHGQHLFQSDHEAFASSPIINSSLNPPLASLEDSPTRIPLSNVNIPPQNHNYIAQDASVYQSQQKVANSITYRDHHLGYSGNTHYSVNSITQDDDHNIIPSFHYQQVMSQIHGNVASQDQGTHHTQLSHASIASYGSSNSDDSPFSHVRNPSADTVDTKHEEDNHQPLIKTAFWEDENTICYQVEVDGILVSRREDNNYINGTKLLNVAGLSRGKRDGMLKLERHKSIVKVGSMNLKGVWLPYARATEIARNLGIKNKLYPLLREDLSDFFRKEGVHLKRDDYVMFVDGNES